MDKLRYPGQKEPSYEGKVRIVSTVGDIVIAETTNQISAFDVVLPVEIPRKGAVLNLISANFFNATSEIIPNCLLSVPHPRFSMWRKTTPFKFEVIVRGYNTGSFYKDYSSKGITNYWNYHLPNDLKKDQVMPFPLLTPTTKAEIGLHDQPITWEEIVSKNLATEIECEIIISKALQLFAAGQETASAKGLILVDTKYEFGKDSQGNIYLIDEVHTPDSSRYWYEAEYSSRFSQGQNQKQLSKEFLREWLVEHNFQGRADDVIPDISGELIMDISEKYLELYEILIAPVDEKTLEYWDDETNVYDKVCKELASLAINE